MKRQRKEKEASFSTLRGGLVTTPFEEKKSLPLGLVFLYATPLSALPFVYCSPFLVLCYKSKIQSFSPLTPTVEKAENKGVARSLSALHTAQSLSLIFPFSDFLSWHQTRPNRELVFSPRCLLSYETQGENGSSKPKNCCATTYAKASLRRIYGQTRSEDLEREESQQEERKDEFQKRNSLLSKAQPYGILDTDYEGQLRLCVGKGKGIKFWMYEWLRKEAIVRVEADSFSSQHSRLSRTRQSLWNSF